MANNLGVQVGSEVNSNVTTAVAVIPGVSKKAASLGD
jgi:hypothetical protein